MPYTVWTNKEDEILHSFYGKIPLCKILELLPNRTKNAIRGRVQKLGLKSRLCRRIHSFNDAFFEDINLVNSYWAGFLSADGAITSNPWPRVDLGLSIRDEDVLIKFREHFEGTQPIYYASTWKNGNESKMARLMVSSRQWVNNLRDNFNITDNKTFTLQPPIKLSLQESISFCIGHFNGDGSAVIDNKGHFRMCFMGTKALMEWIKELLNYITDNILNHLNIKKYRNVYHFDITGQKALITRRNILNIFNPDWNLERKWNLQFLQDKYRIRMNNTNLNANIIIHEGNGYLSRNRPRKTLTMV